MSILKVVLSKNWSDLAHSTIVTVAIFAPTQSRQLLAASGDPVYEICKGQPTQLTQTTSTTSIGSQVSAAPTPQTAFYPDGNIIVSADYTGQIKVFRQDCAWSLRRADTSDTASIRLRAKTTLGRGSSIKPSGFTTWRNSNTPTSRTGSTHSSSGRDSMDAAPTNSSQTALSQKNLEVPKQGSNGRNSQSPTRGHPQSNQDSARLQAPSPERLTKKKSTAQERLMLQEDGQSLAFYNLNAQRRDSMYGASERSVSVSPVRRGSASSGGNSLEEMNAREASFVDAQERLSNDDMVCRNCGARTFHAFKVQSGEHKGETHLRCSVYISLSMKLTSGVSMFLIKGERGKLSLIFVGYMDYCGWRWDIKVL